MAETTRVLKELHDGVEIDHIDGTDMYLKGHTVPIKGIPFVEGVELANQLKRELKEAIKRPWHRLPKPRLSLPLCTPCAQEVYRVLYPHFPVLAYYIATILEYDGAYRYRFQDLANETSKGKLIAYPQKELQRLIEINKERDYNIVSEKVRKLTKFTYLLYLPFVRELYTQMIFDLDLTKLKPDDSDRYWMKLKSDYNYFGYAKTNPH